jgi:hypothetical protein
MARALHRTSLSLLGIIGIIRAAYTAVCSQSPFYRSASGFMVGITTCKISVSLGMNMNQNASLAPMPQVHVSLPLAKSARRLTRYFLLT